MPYCSKCGRLLKTDDVYCAGCGSKIGLSEPLFNRARDNSATEFYTDKLPTQKGLTGIPSEIKGWNWGAFFFGWIWGIAHNVWVSLLTIIPFIGVIMLIVLGVKGNEWAWRNRKWDSIEQFKRTQHQWAVAAVVLLLIQVVLIVFVVALNFSTPEITTTEMTTLTPVPVLETGWIRLIIEEIGSIDYPPVFLELQSGSYKKGVELFRGIYEIPSPSFVLQQTGLNEMQSSAFQEYRRVLFQTEYLSPQDRVYKVNEKYHLSARELAEIKSFWISQIGIEFGIGNIVEVGHIEIVELNGMHPILFTYKRQLGDNPVVQVKHYYFFNYDKIHTLTISYRVQDETKHSPVFEKILNSFRLQN